MSRYYRDPQDEELAQDALEACEIADNYEPPPADDGPDYTYGFDQNWGGSDEPW